jgi:hypothetical protein
MIANMITFSGYRFNPVFHFGSISDFISELTEDGTIEPCDNTEEGVVCTTRTVKVSDIDYIESIATHGFDDGTGASVIVLKNASDNNIKQDNGESFTAIYITDSWVRAIVNEINGMPRE